MAGEFARKLKDTVVAAVDGSQSDLRFAFGMVSDVIAEILETLDPLDPMPIACSDYRSASEAMAIARAAGAVLESCQLIEARLLSLHDEPCFQERDLPASRSYESLSKFLANDIVGIAGDRAFVYAVSARGATGCLHLGHVQGAEARARWSTARLDASRPLLTALRQGALITVILPTALPSALPYAGASASDLEAAIRAVLHSQHALSELDVPLREAPPTGPADLGRLLALASRLHLVAN